MQLPIPDDWDGLSTCQWSICWPDSIHWRAILQSFIEQPMQGRLWDFSTGNFLDLREMFRPIYDNNFNLRRAIVSCDDGQFEQLLEAINNVALSAGSGGCGCGGGSRGAGDSEVAPTPYDQAETPTEPPPGFEDMEEYEQGKCNAAWKIVNGLGSDLLSLSALTFGANTLPQIAAVLVAVLVSPMPFDDVIALVALLLYTAFSFTFLAQTASIIYDNIEDVVCSLYGSVSPEGARSALKSKISDLLDSETSWTSGEKEFVLSAVDYFVSWDNLNQLFTPGIYPENADCSTCGCQVVYDNMSDWSEWTYSNTSVNSGSSSGDISGDLSFTLAIASSPAGFSLAQARFAAPLSELASAGFVPGLGSTVSAHVENVTGGTVGFVIIVEYVTAADQVGSTLTLAIGETGNVVIALDEDDTVDNIYIYAGQSRSSGAGTSVGAGDITSVTFDC